MLFAYPRQAAVARVIPKTKLYEHGDANTALRGLFVDQVAKLTLTHVLTPDSTNLPAAGGIDEIDVFRLDVHLPRAQDLDQRVLRCCDRIIPRPTFFEIHAESGIQVMAQVKLPTPATPSPSQSVATAFSTYQCSPVYALDAPRQPLPLVTSLLALYERLLESLLGLERRAQETLTDTVRRRHELTQLDRSIAALRKRTNDERQFNRRVELNAELRDLETQRHAVLAPPR